MSSTTTHPSLSRRDLLWRAGGGLGGVALVDLLARRGELLSQERATPLPHSAPRARSVIQIFCAGAMSQVDTFDYKPELEKRQGKKFDPSGKLQFFASRPGHVQSSYWKFRRHGESARWVSDLLPHLAGCADDMAFVHSMVSRSAVHGPAMFFANTGFVLPGFPSMGAWLSYGLGSETDDLPTFVVLPDSRGVPPGGPATWGSGFLPALHQGTAFATRQGEDPIGDLFPGGSLGQSPLSEAEARRFLARLNRRHAAMRRGDMPMGDIHRAYSSNVLSQLA